MNKEFLTDDGAEIRTTLGSIPYTNNGEYFSIDKFALEAEVGSGGDAAAKISRDNGKTYGNLRYTKVGEKGKHKARLKWRRLGTGYSTIVQVQLSGSVRRRISSIAMLEIS